MVGSWEEGKCGQRHAVISSFHDAKEATPGGRFSKDPVTNGPDNLPGRLTGNFTGTGIGTLS